jgi:hypothetical protein
MFLKIRQLRFCDLKPDLFLSAHHHFVVDVMGIKKLPK